VVGLDVIGILVAFVGHVGQDCDEHRAFLCGEGRCVRLNTSERAGFAWVRLVLGLRSCADGVLAQVIQAVRDVPEGVTRGYACHSQCEICGPEYDRYDQVGERGGKACHYEHAREREAHEYDERVGAGEHVVCWWVEGYYIMAGFGLDLLELGRHWAGFARIGLGLGWICSHWAGFGLDLLELGRHWAGFARVRQALG
jgi:hypothetical protein